MVLFSFATNVDPAVYLRYFSDETVAGLVVESCNLI